MKWWSSRTWIISLIALIWDTFNYLTNRTFEKQIVLYYTVLCIAWFMKVCVCSVRCSNVAHKKPDVQNLFGIVQGGLDPVLRWVHLPYYMYYVYPFFSGHQLDLELTEQYLFSNSRDICVRGLVERNLPGYVMN
jgi:hypothetical protein